MFAGLPVGCPAAGGGRRIVAVSEGLSLIGDDGSTMRLAHVEFVRRKTGGRWLPVDGRLRDWIARRVIGLAAGSGGSFDRGGRLLVDPLLASGRSIALELVESGHAVFRPDLGTAPDPRRMLDAEERARQASLGVWAGGMAGPVDQGTASRLVGYYGLVTGRILHSAEARYYLYVNFGDRWSEDFTLRVPKDDINPLRRAGLDLMLLEGQTVRVRGWVFEENGPMIEIRHRHAVEVLG